jgi:S-adenosylmethionine:tRNA ribosyltransferase-isomerase
MKIDPKLKGNAPQVEAATPFSEGAISGWRLRLPGGRPLATAAVAEGRVYIGGGFGSCDFFALDAVTGQLIWHYQTEDDGQLPDGLWELLVRRAHDVAAEGETIRVEPGPLRLELVRRTADGHWLARPDQPETATELLTRCGQVPLPRFIRRGRPHSHDRQRYQTVYARRAGAVAAPTAGLHFTWPLFEALKKRGITWAFVTLHVGLGTFQSIRANDFRRHPMHREWGELPQATVDAISVCKSRGGRVVAVGTTAMRVLETVAALGPLRTWSGETDLYIHGAYPFRAVDALLTNFHLQRTTLRLLVAAFAGTQLASRAYEVAVEHRYRFYSYGDAMLIL